MKREVEEEEEEDKSRKFRWLLPRVPYPPSLPPLFSRDDMYVPART